VQFQSCLAEGKGKEAKQLSEEEVNVWHKRLGHMSSHALSRLFSVSPEVVNKALNKCNVCPCAKQTRVVFPSSSIKSIEFLI